MRLQEENTSSRPPGADAAPRVDDSVTGSPQPIRAVLPELPRLWAVLGALDPAFIEPGLA